MTLPEHAICSVMIAQFGVRQKLGTRGVALVTLAGIAPDLDTASKLFGDEYFWKLHHVLGHCILSVLVISAVVAAIGRMAFGKEATVLLFRACLVATTVHCLTDSVYWWGVEPFWPVNDFELCFSLIEYLDLIVLGIWLAGAMTLLRRPSSGPLIATVTLCSFSAYVLLRAALPAPTGWLHLLTGGWMYAAPQGTPVLDWW